MYWVNLAIMLLLAYLMIRFISRSLNEYRNEYRDEDHYDQAIKLTKPEMPWAKNRTAKSDTQVPLDDQPAHVIRQIVEKTFKNPPGSS